MSGGDQGGERRIERGVGGGVVAQRLPAVADVRQQGRAVVQVERAADLATVAVEANQVQPILGVQHRDQQLGGELRPLEDGRHAAGVVQHQPDDARLAGQSEPESKQTQPDPAGQATKRPAKAGVRHGRASAKTCFKCNQRAAPGLFENAADFFTTCVEMGRKDAYVFLNLLLIAWSQRRGHPNTLNRGCSFLRHLTRNSSKRTLERR